MDCLIRFRTFTSTSVTFPATVGDLQIREKPENPENPAKMKLWPEATLLLPMPPL